MTLSRTFVLIHHRNRSVLLSPTTIHQQRPTKAALDELDDETLELVIALQLEDAAALEGEGNHSDPNSVDATVSKIYADELHHYKAIRQFEDEETRLSEASAAAASIVECTSCEDSYPVAEVWQAPCSHHYCVGCLEQLHRASMTDETLYPPRCCRREMPWEGVSAKIDNRLATAFEAKKEELDMHVGQRTYCSDAACARFIGVAHITHDTATCPACSGLTCTMCKAAQHDGDCPADAALQQTLRLAEDHGWQRCRQCRSIVDLAFGCYHITCSCRHEFCYVCGEDWKTCPCDQWDEARLVARAQDIVNREPQAAAARPAQHAAQVAREAENLRERHNCNHEDWNRRAGRGACEECAWEADQFTMVCDQCRLRVCRRCMQNRL